MSEMFQELLSSNPYAIIELFELHLDQELHGSTEIVRFHAGANQTSPVGEIYWQGQPYQALPIEAEGFEYSGSGQLPRPTIRVSNLLGSISALLLGVNEITPGNDLTGAKVIRIRTLSRFLDPANFTGSVNPYGTPANEEMPREIYYIDRKSAENREIVEFELASVFDLAGVRAPKRQVIANICQWKYRSAECGYTGSNYFDEYDLPLGATAATNFSATAFGSEISAGETLNAGDALVSSNGWFRSLMQSDGNFVTYDKANKVIWASNTNYGGGYSYSLALQNDGNLVIYKSGQAIWATNTQLKAVLSGLSFVGWYPTDIAQGRSGGFGWECVGSSPSGLGQTNTQNETFSVDGRSLDLTLQFESYEIPAPHYSGQSFGWGLSSLSLSTGSGINSSTGTFYDGEVINLVKTFSNSNPFKGGNPFASVLSASGPSFRVSTVSGYTNNTLTLGGNGNLILQTSAGGQLWTTGVNITAEPYVITGTANPLEDVCGKRISSCKNRFGEYAELPFGSFPSVGTFYS